MPNPFSSKFSHYRNTLSILLFTFALSACSDNDIVVQQRILSFGTLIDITVATEQSNKTHVENSIEQVRNLLKKRHHQWHAWQKGDLSQLNKNFKSAKPSKTSTDLLQLITLSKHYYQSSNGLFNPAMGKLIAAWGFHENNAPDHKTIQAMMPNIPNMDELSIENNHVINTNPDLQLDFGGIAKGLAIQQIKHIFAQNNIQHYLINIGGDLYASGTKHTQKWHIGIQNPYKAEALGGISLNHDSSLFSSGNYQRYYWQNKQRQHHIINPRTGQPSRLNSAVTVLHKNPITADVAATALMIAEQKEWRIISQQLGVKDYLIINEKQQLWVSPDLFAKTTFNSALKTHIISDN